MNALLSKIQLTVLRQQKLQKCYALPIMELAQLVRIMTLPMKRLMIFLRCRKYCKNILTGIENIKSYKLTG